MQMIIVVLSRDARGPLRRDELLTSVSSLTLRFHPHSTLPLTNRAHVSKSMACLFLRVVPLCLRFNAKFLPFPVSFLVLNVTMAFPFGLNQSTHFTS